MAESASKLAERLLVCARAEEAMLSPKAYALLREAASALEQADFYRREYEVQLRKVTHVCEQREERKGASGEVSDRPPEVSRPSSRPDGGGSGVMVDVAGCCPACGSNTLFVAAGGHVTCSLLDCPDPGAADELLSSGKRVRALCELVEASQEYQEAVERFDYANSRAYLRGVQDELGRAQAAYFKAGDVLRSKLAALASLEPARKEEM